MAAIIADDLERTRRFFTSKVNLISGQKAFEGLVDVSAPNRVPGRHLVFLLPYAKRETSSNNNARHSGAV